MKRRIAVFAPILGLLVSLGAGAPSPADAESTTVPGLAAGTYYFDTYLTPEYFGAGSYEGVLRLDVAAGGTISGIFRNVDSGGFRTVTGGETGNDLWLDLGGNDSRPFNVRVENGKLVGGIYTASQPYSFVASPQAHPAL
jgi:hypothetical protein